MTPSLPRRAEGPRVPLRVRRPSGAFALLSLLALLASAVGPTAADAQSGALTGRVLQETGAPVPHAAITVAGTQRGVLAEADGTFRLRKMTAGEHVLVVSAMGFRTVEHRITWPLDGREVTVVLPPDAVGLGALTVTATMQRSSVGASPVKVEVVPAAVLQRNATNNLTEAIQFVNGLTNQLDCGVCYTNSLRINGMEGPYTAVLIDGMPLMSSLASVYGLNGLNPAIVEQVEIVKGPSSTLYGSEAMAGVINVITKDPRFAPRLAVNLSGTGDAEANLDVALASGPGDLSGLLSGNLAYNDRFVDDNGDGFSDFPLVRRAVLFGKLGLADEGRRRGALGARALVEDRFGGVEGWSEEHRGSGSVYGESIRTRRVELLGSWYPSWSDAVRFEGSWTWHDQDSYYGTTRYAARQAVAVGNVFWTERLGRHDLLLGGTFRYQGYDDDTPATDAADRRLIPGVLAQDEMRWPSGFTALAGMRADHHGEHGLILSPRLALKWEATEHTALRLNAGTGFRVVNLFTEDHAALTGSRRVVLASELAPERSWSVAVNMNQVVELGPNPMMIDLDLFHTRFSNKIVPDYDVDPDLIVYDNLGGHAVSRGVSLSLNQNVDFDRFLYSLGFTVQDVHATREGVREDEFFAPSVRAVGSATWSLRPLPLRFDWTGSVTGPMRLPRYDAPHERPDRSPTWTLHNVQATWTLETGVELYLGVKNLTGTVQPSALVDPERPFGEDFDTAWVYGPLRGRHLLVGVRYGVPR